MQGDPLICLRSEFCAKGCCSSFRTHLEIPDFCGRHGDRELGGLGHPTACFLKHSSVGKAVSGVQGLAHGAAEKRNNQGLLTDHQGLSPVLLLQLPCDTKQSPLKISSRQNLPHSHRGKGGNDLNVSRDCKAVRTLAAESPCGGVWKERT